MFSKRKRTVTHSIAEGRGSAACCGIPRAGEQNVCVFYGKKNDDDRAVPLLHNGK